MNIDEETCIIRAVRLMARNGRDAMMVVKASLEANDLENYEVEEASSQLNDALDEYVKDDD